MEPLASAELAAMMDHSVLGPGAVPADISRACAEAREHGMFAVCVAPVWVQLAARGLAPDCAVARTDKMGFPVPIERWAAGPLREEILGRLARGPLVPAGILAPGAPERLLATAGGHGRHLWFFLLLSEWMEATGIRIDVDALREMSREMDEAARDANAER